MEEIEDRIKNISKKISKLNDFISLTLRKDKISKELDQLNVEAVKIRDVITEAHEVMQKDLNSLKYDYEAIMSEMRKKQVEVMGYIIKEKQRKNKEIEEETKKINLLLTGGKSYANSINTSDCKNMRYLSGLNVSHSLSVTPKIKVNGYKESTLVKKKTNPLFQFEEFDVTIDQRQFDSIPKYMCGRETLDQLNGFLQTVVIPCFNEKYKLMHKERSCLRSLQDIELWKLYNEQASYVPGHNFITPGDLTRKLNKMLDKKSQNRLTMLRHIGILSEVRVKQTVCYVWSIQ